MREHSIHLIPAYRTYIEGFISPFELGLEIILTLHASFVVKFVERLALRTAAPEHAFYAHTTFGAAFHGQIDRFTTIRAGLGGPFPGCAWLSKHVAEDISESHDWTREWRFKRLLRKALKLSCKSHHNPLTES